MPQLWHGHTATPGAALDALLSVLIVLTSPGVGEMMTLADIDDVTLFREGG